MIIEKSVSRQIIKSIGAFLLIFFASYLLVLVTTPQEPEKYLVQGTVTEVFPTKNMIRVYDKERGSVYSVTVSPEKLNGDTASTIKFMDTVTIQTEGNPAETQTLSANIVQKSETSAPSGGSLMPISASSNFSF